MTTLGVIRQALGACLLSVATYAQAASLQISPVILNLGSAERAASMVLRNQGPTPIYGQVRVYAWHQTVSEDVLRETSALIASPPMIQIAPGGTQTVRLLQPTPSGKPDSEQSYRLIIDEIAPPDAMRETGVQVRLRYSVPVFVGASPQTPVQEDLIWSLVPDGGKWALRVDNNGRHRAQLSDVALAFDGQVRNMRDGLLGYVLGGSARQWSLPFQPASHKSVSVQARVNSTPIKAVVQPAPGK